MIPLAAFPALLLLGSGALALWADLRFRRPGLTLAVANLLASLLLGGLLAPSLLGLAVAHGQASVVLAALLLVGYPLLAAIWLLRALAAKLPRGGSGLGEAA